MVSRPDCLLFGHELEKSEVLRERRQDRTGEKWGVGVRVLCGMNGVNTLALLLLNLALYTRSTAYNTVIPFNACEMIDMSASDSLVC